MIKKSLKCAMYHTVKFYSEIHRKKIVLESVKDKEGWRGLRRKTWRNWKDKNLQCNVSHKEKLSAIQCIK